MDHCCRLWHVARHLSPPPTGRRFAGPTAERGAVVAVTPPATTPPGGAAPVVDLAGYHERGFTIVRAALLPEDFAALEAAYDRLIDGLAAEWLAVGRIRSAHAAAPFSERLARIVAELPVEEVAGMVAQGGALAGNGPLDIFHAQQRAMFEFTFKPRLLALLEQIIGPELLLSPIQHIRPHLARGDTQEAHVWHMDQSVTLEEADNAEIVTVWVPLVDVDRANGCLQVLDRRRCY